MSRAVVFVALILASIPVAAHAALPRAGKLVPGASLGGVRLGDTPARVRAVLGGSYGVCRGCATTTWYFTYGRFQQQGLGVELAGGRVSAVYTLWQPDGWSTPDGLALGVDQGEVTASHAPLIPVACVGYTAFVDDNRAARTAYYVVDGKLWGFGLVQRRQSPCR
jgi:hypothetical protein